MYILRFCVSFFDMTKNLAGGWYHYASIHATVLLVHSSYYVLRSIYEFVVKVFAHPSKVFLQLALVTCTHFPRSMFHLLFKAYLFVKKPKSSPSSVVARGLRPSLLGSVVLPLTLVTSFLAALLREQLFSCTSAHFLEMPHGLEIRIIIKISTYPCYPRTFDCFSWD